MPKRLIRHQETQVQLGMPQVAGDGLFMCELAEEAMGLSGRFLLQARHNLPETRQGFVR